MIKNFNSELYLIPVLHSYLQLKDASSDVST